MGGGSLLPGTCRGWKNRRRKNMNIAAVRPTAYRAQMSRRALRTAGLSERNYGDANLFEFCSVNDLIVFQISDSCVEHEIELSVHDCAGRREAHRRRPVLEYFGRGDAQTIWRQPPASDAIRSRSILPADEVSLVAI